MGKTVAASSGPKEDTLCFDCGEKGHYRGDSQCSRLNFDRQARRALARLVRVKNLDSPKFKDQDSKAASVAKGTSTGWKVQDAKDQKECKSFIKSEVEMEWKECKLEVVLKEIKGQRED